MTEIVNDILEEKIADIIRARITYGGYATEEVDAFERAVLWAEGMGIDIQPYWDRFIEARGYD